MFFTFAYADHTLKRQIFGFYPISAPTNENVLMQISQAPAVMTSVMCD